MYLCIYIMSTIKQLKEAMLSRLRPLYGADEAQAIYLHLTTEVLGCSPTELFLMDKDTPISQDRANTLREMLQRLERREPLQYVLGYAYFSGLRLRVASGVLIPRPETEELVAHIIAHHQDDSNIKTALDVATGSGCITLGLASQLTSLRQMDALELSDDALAIASANIKMYQADCTCQIQLLRGDMLQWAEQGGRAMYDLIVSNPPYILPQESEEMSPNVLAYEPHTALFVPAEQPYLFYEAIAEIALHRGKPGCHIYAELNALLAQGTLDAMLAILGERVEHAELLHDLTARPRFAHIHLS